MFLKDSYIYKNMVAAGADGIDYVGLFPDKNGEVEIYRTFTIEQMKQNPPTPRAGYKFWKYVNGKKEYI